MRRNGKMPAESAIPSEHKSNKPELVLADGEGKVKCSRSQSSRESGVTRSGISHENHIKQKQNKQ